MSSNLTTLIGGPGVNQGSQSPPSSLNTTQSGTTCSKPDTPGVQMSTEMEVTENKNLTSGAENIAKDTILSHSTIDKPTEKDGNLKSSLNDANQENKSATSDNISAPTAIQTENNESQIKVESNQVKQESKPEASDSNLAETITTQNTELQTKSELSDVNQEIISATSDDISAAATIAKGNNESQIKAESNEVKQGSKSEPNNNNSAEIITSQNTELQRNSELSDVTQEIKSATNDISAAKVETENNESQIKAESNQAKQESITETNDNPEAKPISVLGNQESETLSSQNIITETTDKNSISINEKDQLECNAYNSEGNKESGEIIDVQLLTEQILNMLNDGQNETLLSSQELLKKKIELEEFMVKLIEVLKEKTNLCANLEKQNAALIGQAKSLKDVISITKDLLGIRNMEVEHLHADMSSMENRIKEERLRHNTAVARLNEAMTLNDKLKAEYLVQMDLFQKLREKYNEKVVILTKENQRLNEIVKSNGLGQTVTESDEQSNTDNGLVPEEIIEENVDK